MSYILDALKRADADRERGHVPGLHSHTAGLGAAGPSGLRLDSRFAIGQRPGLWAALALALLMAAGAAAWWWSRPATAPAWGPVAAVDREVPDAPGAGSTPASATVEPAPVERAAPPTAPATATAVDAPTTRPAPAVLPILAPPLAPPPAPPPAPPVSRPTPATAATAAKATGSVAASAELAPASSTPAASTATAAVRRFADLPPDTRAQLPAVNVSGSTYSQNPALRMLIVNGKVMQEGSEITPGFTVETIGPRSAVLNHQGVRYSIGY